MRTGPKARTAPRTRSHPRCGPLVTFEHVWAAHGRRPAVSLRNARDQQAVPVKIAHRVQQPIDLNGLAEERHGTGLVALHHVLVFGRAGENDDRDVAQAAVGQSVLAALLLLPALMALGIGLSVHNARAVFQGLSGGRGEFVRTPKPVRLEGGVRRQVTPGRFVGWQVALEAVLALYFAAATVVAWNLGMWGVMPFVLLLQSGYTWVAMGSLTEWFRRRRLEVVTVRAVT